MNITEQELLNIGFVRIDWTHGDENCHAYILQSKSAFKIEVYDDFSSSLTMGHECRGLPRTTGIEEIRSLARILNITPTSQQDPAAEARLKVYQESKLEPYH